MSSLSVSINTVTASNITKQFSICQIVEVNGIEPYFSSNHNRTVLKSQNTRSKQYVNLQRMWLILAVPVHNHKKYRRYIEHSCVIKMQCSQRV